MKKIILASKSIDRSKILRRARVPFQVLITHVNEDEFKSKISDPVKLVVELARQKALIAKSKLSPQNNNAIIIGADTIVEHQGEIIGKARNENEAFDILKKLQGKGHNLITGIAITEVTSDKMFTDYESTAVKFINLSDEEIWAYIKAGEWRGRAGAYSIRDKASLFVDFIVGSSSNVIGLPLHKVYTILKHEFNINLLINLK